MIHDFVDNNLCSPLANKSEEADGQHKGQNVRREPEIGHLQNMAVL
jgi:hypothetical protein